MTKFVVTYLWKETCYVEAGGPDEAQEIADGIEMKATDLELCHEKTRVRNATRLERELETFDKAEEKP